MAKRSPSRLCSEPASSSLDQCRCSCLARYWEASPPPAIVASSPSNTITEGHRTEQRVLIPTPARLSWPLFPAPPRQDLPSYLPPFMGLEGVDGSSGMAPGLFLAPHWPPCLHLPLHTPHCPEHEISVSPSPAVTPWLVPWRPQGNVQTPQPWVTCTSTQLCQPWAGSAPPSFTLCPPSTRSHVQFPEHPKLFHASAFAHVP